MLGFAFTPKLKSYPPTQTNKDIFYVIAQSIVPFAESFRRLLITLLSNAVEMVSGF